MNPCQSRAVAVSGSSDNAPSYLPLIVFVSMVFAMSAAAYAVACGCSALEVMWAYIKSGSLTCVIFGATLGFFFPR